MIAPPVCPTCERSPEMDRALDTASARALNAYLERHRTPLRDLAWIAEQSVTPWPRWAWSVRVMTKAEFCALLDERGRGAKHEADRLICKNVAAWARGNPDCVWLAIWTCGHLHRGTTWHAERRPRGAAR